MDDSNIPGTGNPLSVATIPGVTVNANNVGGVQSGTVASSLAVNVTNTYSGFGQLVGTQVNDTFKQTGPGTYNFQGGGGLNTLDLSNAPSGATVNADAVGGG